VFRDGASRLPLALAALGEGERALAMEATRLRAQGERALAAFETAFAGFYPSAMDAWLAGAPRPAMLCDLPARVARLAAERRARGTALVVMTGLRLDAWRRLETRVLPRVPGLTVLEQGLHWAARPATPATQRELLARGLAALGGHLPPRDEPVPPRTLQEALRPRREHLGHVEVLRIDAYAVELSRSERPLGEALGAVESQLPGVLASLCGGLATRTVLAIAGDVGLREVTRRADEKERGRYAYGGDSPFVAVVPYAVLAWG
jgi:hypothetical protein